MSIIYSLLVFILVILIHEFGHFIVAKLNNIKVNEFSIGMGPVLFSKEKGETKYSLRALPIGGFVALEGEGDNSEDPRSFNKAHPLKRIAVLFAGAFMNFVLAIILGIIVFSYIGQETTTINSFVENSPAKEAGILEGDKIITIDNLPIKEWQDISKTLNSLKKEEVLIKVERNEEYKEVSVKTKNDGNNFVIGVYPKMEKSVGKAIPNSFKFTVNVVKQVYKFIGQLVTGRAELKGVSGPVGIVKIIGDSAKFGFINVLLIACMISANLGAFNLLPFPALDGGTIVITFIEMILRKNVPENIKIGLNLIGLVILFGLIGYVTIFNDIL